MLRSCICEVPFASYYVVMFGGRGYGQVCQKYDLSNIASGRRDTIKYSTLYLDTLYTAGPLCEVKKELISICVCTSGNLAYAKESEGQDSYWALGRLVLRTNLSFAGGDNE
jgi:hypothetical protein